MGTIYLYSPCLSFCSEVFSSCVNAIESAVERVCGELGEMCSQYSWLNDVSQFIITWEGREKMASLSAEEYKVRKSCIYVCVVELPVQ